MRYQRLTRTAILTAICVVLGYLFLPIPNLEMITAGIFISGVWMGPRAGLLIGTLAEAIYSLLNPMGFPPPPLLAAQVLGMALVGLTGGIMRGYLLREPSGVPWKGLKPVVLALVGLILTVIFDALTTLSFPLASGFDLQQIKIALALGVSFTAAHEISNVFIFALVVPVIINRFPAWRNP